MGNRYSKWNMAKTYKKKSEDIIDVFKGREMCFFQYKATRIYEIHTYIQYNHSVLDDIDVEILARIIASGVIVMEQLYCYLYIQGMDVSMQEVIQRVKVLQSKNMIKKGIIINGKKQEFINHTFFEDMEFFEPTKVGEKFLKNIVAGPIKQYEPERENSISWYEYVRSTIMWNQIILKLLLSDSKMKSFNLYSSIRRKYYEKKGICIPLMIDTGNRVYVFEFVRGINEGKEIVEKKWKQWNKHPKLYGKNMSLVFLCENEYHMEMMALYLCEIINEKNISLFFSNDELWFGITTNKIKKLCLPEGKLENSRFM